MKKLTKVSAALIAIVSLVIAFSACNRVEFSYWQITAKQSGETRLTYISDLTFGATNVDITEVWINVSDLKASSTTVSFEFIRSTASDKTINYVFSKDDLKNAQDGWLCAYHVTETEISTTRVTVSAVDTLRLNEVVFITKDGKLAKPSFVEGGVQAGTSSSTMYDKEGLDNLPETDMAYNENPAYNIVDEQDKFPTELIKTKG